MPHDPLTERKFRRWAEIQSPCLTFPSYWTVQPLPPFGGAAYRFLVWAVPNFKISVYADFDDSLGSFGLPYWEIYPDHTGNNARFALADTNGLLKALHRVLEPKGS